MKNGVLVVKDSRMSKKTRGILMRISELAALVLATIISYNCKFDLPLYMVFFELFGLYLLGILSFKILGSPKSIHEIFLTGQSIFFFMTVGYREQSVCLPLAIYAVAIIVVVLLTECVMALDLDIEQKPVSIEAITSLGWREVKFDWIKIVFSVISLLLILIKGV